MGNNKYLESNSVLDSFPHDLGNDRNYFVSACVRSSRKYSISDRTGGIGSDFSGETAAREFCCSRQFGRLAGHAWDGACSFIWKGFWNLVCQWFWYICVGTDWDNLDQLDLDLLLQEVKKCC